MDRKAVRTFLRGRRGHGFRFLQAVHRAYKHEDHEGNDDEINDGLHKRAPLDNCITHSDCQIAEIDPAQERARSMASEHHSQVK